MNKSFPALISNLKIIRKMTADFLKGHELNHNKIKEIELGVDEAITNIIRHSYKVESKENIIAIKLELIDNKVIIHLYDNGTPINEEKIKPRELDDIKPGGLGTYFINKIMDEVKWSKSDKWINHLTLVKKISN